MLRPVQTAAAALIYGGITSVQDDLLVVSRQDARRPEGNASDWHVFIVDATRYAAVCLEVAGAAELPVGRREAVEFKYIENPRGGAQVPHLIYLVALVDSEALVVVSLPGLWVSGADAASFKHHGIE